MDVVTALRHHLERPTLQLLDQREEPLEHDISAPTTASVTRVHLHLRDPLGDLRLSCVRKVLQAARHGLPPVIPPEVIAHLDAVIPWRLESDVLTPALAAAMPPGLRAPEVLARLERPDDRIELWLRDVEPVPASWTAGDTVHAARLLGRLAARRRDEPQPAGPRFLDTYRWESVAVWSAPRLLDPATWAHPVFRDPAVVGLRGPLLALVAGLPRLDERLAAVPVLPAHGDATPLNLLRPGVDPDDLVLLDWASATPGPAGWDVVPLVFGLAECGRQDVSDARAVLDDAIAAYGAGLAEEGFELAPDRLRTAVVTAAQLRYAFTTLPLGVLDGVPLPDPDPSAYLARRAALVRCVLDLTPGGPGEGGVGRGRLAGWSATS
ncbi:hypothetical protein ACFFKU_17735 [Kineococcus gynurae]|uniref:Phosphotransferase family enzyme n=1 Tax=Kineococcus gynurae TaxID=452979 RepID=A0ABV5LNM2_9ACTN